MKLDAPELTTGVVGLIGALGTYLAGRKHGQGTFINAVHEAAHIVIKDLRDECDRLKDQHVQCERRLGEIQSQIDALMHANPAAVYHVEPKP